VARLNIGAGDGGTYSVTATVNGCVSTIGSVNVVVNQTPAQPTASNNGPKCKGDNISLVATPVSGATYSWTGPGGYTSIQQNPVLTNVTTADAGTYSVVTQSSGCSSASSNTDVVVNNFPAAPVLSSIPFANACAGDSLQLFATFLNGGTYEWTGPIGFGALEQNPVIRNITTARSGQYSATVTKAGCTSQPGVLNITVNNLPTTGSISGSTPVRNYELKTYSVSGSTGSSYTWEVSTGHNIPNPGAGSSIDVQWGAEDADAWVSVIEKSSVGCFGPLRKLNVRVVNTVGESEVEQAASISMWPNPAEGELKLLFHDPRASVAQVRMMNMLGQVALTTEISTLASPSVIDVGGLRAGVYFVEVACGSQTTVYRVSIR
jgi:hypothetical protein